MVSNFQGIFTSQLYLPFFRLISFFQLLDYSILLNDELIHEVTTLHNHELIPIKMAIMRLWLRNERGKFFSPTEIWTVVPLNQKPVCYKLVYWPLFTSIRSPICWSFYFSAMLYCIPSSFFKNYFQIKDCPNINQFFQCCHFLIHIAFFLYILLYLFIFYLYSFFCLSFKFSSYCFCISLFLFLCLYFFKRYEHPLLLKQSY